MRDSFYAAGRCRELEHATIRVRREVAIPVVSKGEPLPLGFRTDLLADEIVIPEIKVVPALLAVDAIQLQTYPSMRGLPEGVLFNFHAFYLGG